MATVVDVVQRPDIAAVGARLAELAQEDHGHCLSCGYGLKSPDWAICSCCLTGCWPPFNEHFRCPLEARIGWMALQFALGRAKEIQTIPLFPGDRPQVTLGAKSRGSSLFAALKQVDLSVWAGQYTQLQQIGPSRWRGLCPIHSEKTGSFYVFQAERGWTWRCFGACAQGGDIVDLARELKLAGKR